MQLKDNISIYLTIVWLMVFIMVQCPMIHGDEAECLYKRIMCYECESTSNPKCKDPFNVSLREDLKDVPLIQCSGCCIKIVTNINSPDVYVRRTCTQRIQINHFIVDHVCMEESNGQGHMCFCESDGCNTGSPKVSLPPSSHTLFMIIWPLAPFIATLLSNT